MAYFSQNQRSRTTAINGHTEQLSARQDQLYPHALVDIEEENGKGFCEVLIFGMFEQRSHSTKVT